MEISPSGENKFLIRGFQNRQKLMNHWKNGRTHSAEYPGFTIRQYEQRAVELLEQATSEKILGHADKNDYLVRYDKEKNDFAKGHPCKGVVTMFKPVDGENYYFRSLKGDMEHGGRK